MDRTSALEALKVLSKHSEGLPEDFKSEFLASCKIVPARASENEIPSIFLNDATLTKEEFELVARMTHGKPVISVLLDPRCTEEIQMEILHRAFGAHFKESQGEPGPSPGNPSAPSWVYSQLPRSVSKTPKLPAGHCARTLS